MNLGALTGIEVLVLFVVLFGLLVFVIVKGAWIQVNERKVVPAEAARLEAPLRRLLASVPDSELLDSRIGSFTLVLRRRPLWMVVAILLTLPIGLFFLAVKDTAVVQVTLLPSGAQTEVRIVGRTSRRVLRMLDDALAPVRRHEVSVR